ncbi:YbhB/YbcL family Raf kinase inhibitor-like protein [Streptomyces canus]|uniref:YbhB/YbcL family Raf kinase inhibitor-like protein n=1 Tax=Streptomyces canus TaxID=58343 RepID=UPI0036CDF72B
MLATPDPYTVLPQAPVFTLRSNDIAEGRDMPVAQRSPAMGGPGNDESPHLVWEGFAPGTRSFAVTCFDVDAPTGSGFWHWAVYNLPGSVTELPSGAGAPGGAGLPAGAKTVHNDGRQKRYMGAAPPPGTGTHRYIFAVHALDVDSLDIEEGSTPAWLNFHFLGHTLGRATLTAVCTAAD